MPAQLLLLLLGLYSPDNWRCYPSMDQVRSVTAGSRDLYVAVPAGIYVFDNGTFNHRLTLTAADGLAGEVRLCAFLPGRNLLYVSTDGHLYEYVPATGVLRELTVPFSAVGSIGIAQDVAYFETDRGLFRRVRAAPSFEPVQSLPVRVTWYGDRDDSDPRDFPVLTPWYVMDDLLEHHQLEHVWREPRGRRLYAAAGRYGLVVFDPETGFQENHIRLGPTGQPVQRVLHLDGRRWFMARERAVSLDSAGRWKYHRAGPGLPAPKGLRLLLANVADLDRREGLAALLPDSAGLLLGTGQGLYRLGPGDKLSPLLQLPLGVNAVARVGDSVVVGTDDGLFLLVNDTLTAVTDPFARFDWGVFDIASSGGGTFFAALGGIVHLTPADTWTRLLPPGTDLGQPVRALAAGGDFLFYGSAAGLGAYDWRTGAWHGIDVARGLPSTDVTALSADEDYLWIVSPGFICRYDYRADLR
ncbi:hypothetical protein FJY71_01925 [candidate division WOR-3 bacterium]|nr:hypothetical protein [candidate division WOR-3 bacterium]